jgi:hypothetical protein
MSVKESKKLDAFDSERRVVEFGSVAERCNPPTRFVLNQRAGSFYPNIKLSSIQENCEKSPSRKQSCREGNNACWPRLRVNKGWLVPLVLLLSGKGVGGFPVALSFQHPASFNLMSARPVITIDLLNRLKSPRGGYSRESLQYLGIGWPPKRGWRKALIKEARENHVNQVVTAPIASEHSNVDIIRGRFLIMLPIDRLALLESLRQDFCFLCGSSKQVCKC